MQSKQDQILDFIGKINDKLNGYLALVLAAAVVLLLIILIIVACVKNGRIRSLKRRLASAEEQLDSAKSQLSREEAFTPVTGEAVFDEGDSFANDDKPVAYIGKSDETAPEQEKQPAPAPEREKQPEQEKQPGPAPKPAGRPAPKAQPTVTLTPTAEAYAATRPDGAREETATPEPESGSAKPADKDAVKYVVKYDRMKDSWIIQRSGSDRVVRRLKTKEEAVSEARAICKRQNATLVVHKKDGKFQKQ